MKNIDRYGNLSVALRELSVKENKMIKIFMTGDNHIGKKYDRYPTVKDRLIQSRIDCIRDMVQQAENEECGLFVVTGDLFDNVSSVKVGDVKKIVDILAGFSGNVLVLPGNHDYYTGEEKVWKDFEKALQNVEHNITLLTELREYEFEVGEEIVIVYPAFCQSKHSEKNNLEWIKSADIRGGEGYSIGIAHGAIKGITPDMNEEYFLMTENELLDIPVDVWLIGHTHVQYPSNLKEREDIVGYKIFNAGSHEQTSLNNNTEGCCFIITLEKVAGRTRVSAHKYISGKVRYYDLKLDIKPEVNSSLREELERLTADLGANSIVRVELTGTIEQEEYDNRKRIYKEVLERFLAYDEVVDGGLSERITLKKIQSEFSELSFAAKLLERLIDEPVELQMAYNMLQACRK